MHTPLLHMVLVLGVLDFVDVALVLMRTRAPATAVATLPNLVAPNDHHQVGKGVTAAKDAVYGVADAAGSVAEQLQDAAGSGGWLSLALCQISKILYCWNKRYMSIPKGLAAEDHAQGTP